MAHLHEPLGAAGAMLYVNAGTRLGLIESVGDIFSAPLILSFALLGIFPLAEGRSAEIAPRLGGLFQAEEIRLQCRGDRRPLCPEVTQVDREGRLMRREEVEEAEKVKGRKGRRPFTSAKRPASSLEKE